MNNGGDFQREGASCTPEAQGSQLEVWIGARAHVSPPYLLALLRYTLLKN